VSGEASRDSIAYLEWLAERHPEFHGRSKVFASDVRLVSNLVPTASIGAIVAEPYLGPPQSGDESHADLKQIMDVQLVPLYRDACTAFAKLLAPGGSAVVAFPIFGKGRQSLFVPIDEICGELAIEPLLPTALTTTYNLLTTPSGGYRYERPDQKVGREIVLLRKG
jgi:hypothetical protein